MRADDTTSGCWASRGYGWLLEVDADRFTLHHASRINLVTGERGAFADAYEVVDVSAERLRLRQTGDLTTYAFVRQPGLPELPRFAAGGKPDPVLNFETLWHVFDEHYGFFGVHNVDWAAVYARHRPRVTPRTPPDALLDLFGEMLLPLDDGHVGVDAGHRAVGTLRAMPLRRAVQQAFDMPQPRVSVRSTVDAIAARQAELMLAPFAASRTELKRAGNGILAWCRLTPDIGYLGVLRLFGFADTAAARTANDLPHARPAVAAFLRDDLAALEAALDDVFADLAGCRALVLDLRINGGGFDRAGLAIAARLCDRRRVAFAKRARKGRGWTADQRIELSPTARAGFAGPVFVLTSPLCVSAGEVMTLCLRTLPQVRVIGQPTAGMLSDNLNKPLPNGWEFSLSNEAYIASDGQIFEGIGIAPDIALPVLDAERLVPTMQEALMQTVAMIDAGSAAVPARHE